MKPPPPAPALNLVVLRTSDLPRARAFYTALGITFEEHRHGTGPLHLAALLGPAVFELYPRRNDTDNTTATRIGLAVPDLDAALAKVGSIEGVRIVTPPQDSPWGRRAVVNDPDGHTVELTLAPSSTSPAQH